MRPLDPSTHRRTALAIATLGVAIACARAVPVPGGVDAVHRPLTTLSPPDIALLADLLAAADSRRPDTAAVDRALAASTPFVRAYAARTVGQIGITSRTARLHALVADPDSTVAADAAFALGMLHDSTAAPELTAALSGTPTVVAAAAWSLGELGEAARVSLEQVLRAGRPSTALPAVLQAVAKLRPVPVSLVLPFVARPDGDVRRSAVYAVTRSRAGGATAALLETWERIRSAPSEPGAGSTDRDVEVRTDLARGLSKERVADSLAPRALTALRQMLGDDHPHVRINAARSLATFGSPGRDDLVRGLRDPDGNVRIAIAQSLGGVLAGATVWGDAWSADTGFTFRRAILAGALRSGVRLPALDPSAHDSWQRSDAWRYRAAAAQAAGEGSIGDIDAVAVPLLRDPDSRVRAAAFAVAANWVDSAASANKPYGRTSLVSSLDDSDVFVRATILDALRRRARAADASIALRQWHRASHDADNDARLAALRVIVAAWKADSVSFGPLRDSLRAIIPPDDPLEREVGRAIGPWSAWAARVGTAKPPAWYAEQVRKVIARDLAGDPDRAIISTSRGDIQIVFRGADAPLTVVNFIDLARRRYFDGLAFHRVVPNFVAQDGDPRGDGSGGPGYAIRDELNRQWYDRGAIGMALSGPDTGGSQYFLAHSSQPHLDGHYTVFAHVIAGYDVLDRLVQGDRIASIRIR